MRNTTSEMRWWRTNSFGGGEKDGEWNGSLFLGRKGLEGMVVCGREERRGERREEKEEEKEIYFLSILILQTPSAPLRGLHPAGIHPAGIHSPHHTLPSQHRPKNGGSPPPPHQGKGRKKRGKTTLYYLINLHFSLWGRTPRPPHSTGTRKKKTRKAGARVNLTGRTKSIDLKETSSMALSVSS